MTKGRCLCGHVSFEVAGDPGWICYCHCESCRRHSGSPVTAFVNHPRDAVRFASEPSAFESSPGVSRSFCPKCGTPVAYETQKRPGEIDLYLGLFDAPEALRPQFHAYSAEALPWVDLHDDLPRK